MWVQFIWQIRSNTIQIHYKCIILLIHFLLAVGEFWMLNYSCLHRTFNNMRKPCFPWKVVKVTFFTVMQQVIFFVSETCYIFVCCHFLGKTPGSQKQIGLIFNEILWNCMETVQFTRDMTQTLAGLSSLVLFSFSVCIFLFLFFYWIKRICW